MKLKTVLVLSLIVNAVLLGAFGYLQSKPVEPLKSSPILYYVNRSNPESPGKALEPVTSETVAP